MLFYGVESKFEIRIFKNTHLDRRRERFQQRARETISRALSLEYF